MFLFFMMRFCKKIFLVNLGLLDDGLHYLNTFCFVIFDNWVSHYTRSLKSNN